MLKEEDNYLEIRAYNLFLVYSEIVALNITWMFTSVPIIHPPTTTFVDDFNWILTVGMLCRTLTFSHFGLKRL